ncbi:uncharacterized protein BDR25DRAFT_299578 [Lindgomyces ingoldianus]|uniref:Uncharacterized protein n=1 Tax=Lindgomyces ingoldianus TaxID=673940 RepID=A0ACB6REK3_9PLEO|nr:uncharacterized protein BDR25DRAFT_299578 [Lindgomyces ingoldianus]KAF2477784.1 hypothetical protein BDR25DRAFT_299578 [Lindgomyces ingoldianus]
MPRPTASPLLLTRFARRAPTSPLAAGRCINITAAALSKAFSTQVPGPAHINTADSPTQSPGSSPDARFEVVGSPFSLLSVSLDASQYLYTRRGTLVGLSGKAENTLSTLSFLGPIRRAPFGIPFLYQKVSSTSPITALVSTKSPIASIVTVTLDGRNDWLIAQRQALLAWTGQALSLAPRYNVKLGVAHWGNTYVTGRGLLALVGSGQIYQVQLKAGESYIAHPSNVLAYTAATNPPSPFRFKSASIRFQIPDFGFRSLLLSVKFFRVMSETATWTTLATLFHTMKIWARRSIWGDRLFLRFEGPTTMLLQSRGSRISDVLTLRDVSEIAETPPGAVQDAVSRKIQEEIKEISSSSISSQQAIASQPVPDGSKVQYATIRNGKAEFDNS